jgi:moderate conductance mechanosensitive channel
MVQIEPRKTFKGCAAKAQISLEPVKRRSSIAFGAATLLSVLALFPIFLYGQVKPSAGEQKPAPSQASELTSSTAIDQQPGQTSDAEMISGIGQLYEKDRLRLKQIHIEQQKVETEYREAEREFEQLNKSFVEKKEQLNSQEGKPVTPSRQQEIGSLEKHWQLAKDRFDLIIQQRKALQALTGILEEKIRLEKAGLDRLTGATQKKSIADRPPSGVGPAGPVAKPQVRGPSGLEEFGFPGMKTTSPQESPQTPAPSREPADPADQQLPSEALLQARDDLHDRRLELKEAKDQLQDADRAIKVFDSELKTEQQLLEIARKQTDNAEQALRVFKEETSTTGIPQPTSDELRRRIQDTNRRLQSYRDAIEQGTARAGTLQTTLDGLRDLRATTDDKYQQAIAAANSARQKVEWLESPLAPQKILQWIYRSGPKIIASLLLVGFLLWLSRVLGHRIVRAVAIRSGPGSIAEREKRSDTLIGVFNNATTVAIIVFGALMLLQSAGINVTVLLGGAAVIGVAVAFGAQNLTRDYFSGFVMLLENQYGVNDIVKIGGIAGLVERISLRMTVLRDLEGVVHFIPHGEVATVSNLTHGWSRALFDIGVAYKEDADRVMRVLVELGKELRQDPYYGELILDDAEMLGVDSFGDSAVVIKFFIKTRPQKQFTVKREMLRRIKRKFDELGIEIPFPHRTVYLRSMDDITETRHGESDHP